MVASGTAVLLRGEARSPWDEPSLLDDPQERVPMGPGDAAVVPAGTVHHFVEVSPDFATWMMFWGPEGGEAP